MFPTARKAFGLPARFATSLYVKTDPFEIFDTTLKTFSSNRIPDYASELVTGSIDKRKPSPRRTTPIVSNRGFPSLDKALYKF